MYKKTIQLDFKKFFNKLNHNEKQICCLLNSNNRGWPKTISFDPIKTISIKLINTKKLNNFKIFIKKNQKLKRKLIGYISYDTSYFLHNIKKTAKSDVILPEIYFCAFDNWITFNNDKATITYKDKTFLKKIEKINSRILNLPKKSINSNFKATITKKEYHDAYKKIIHYIKEGDIYQINYTHRLEAKTNLQPKEIFLKTIKSNPVDFLAYIEGFNFEIISASPERFIKINKNKIETCPVKGTRPRGKTKEEDEKFKKELIENKKEEAELNMITDLLRNDLGKVCKTGSVKVQGHRLINKCPTVWHTYSKIIGEIDEKFTSLDALLSMLPGGSITGCPKKRAIEIIDELEKNTRGIYTGIIGYIDPNQDMDFNIAIRTIIKKKNILYLQVGGGIVIDSTNKSEYEETLHKARSFMEILK